MRTFCGLCDNVSDVWPKIPLLLPVQPRDTQRLDTPARQSDVRRGCTFSRLVWRATEADTLGEASRGASGNRGVVPPKNIHASDPPPCAAPERGCRSPPDPAPSFPGAPLAAPEEVTPPRLERAGQLPGNGERVRGPIKPTRCPAEAAPLGTGDGHEKVGRTVGQISFRSS